MAMWYLHANIETVYNILVLITYVSREDSDKSVHPCSSARALAAGTIKVGAYEGSGKALGLGPNR